jgi:hypothetical protein
LAVGPEFFRQAEHRIKQRLRRRIKFLTIARSAAKFAIERFQETGNVEAIAGFFL